MGQKKICVIPARMASTRFPDKPMKNLLGMPMINHIYHRCKLYKSFDEVIVATCDKEIQDSIESIGGKVILTGDHHERCTDRVEEAISKLDYELEGDDLIIMVQGDEIFVTPDMLQNMAESYHPVNSPVVNIISRFEKEEDCDDINTVKVVCDLEGHILYMTRAHVPSPARSKHNNSFQQTGIIGFSWDKLKKFSSLEQTPLEKIESVDMLRYIENKIPIKAIPMDQVTIGVDVPEELSRSEELLKNDPLVKRYL